MSEFTYLFRGGRPAGAAPEQWQQQMQKWVAWIKQLGEDGHIKDQGRPLERTGKVVTGKEKTIVDGPYAETKAALMCFDAARVPARLDPMGNLSSLFEQNRSKWDPQLVSEGNRFLNLADHDRLAAYPFYSAALGELELRRGRPQEAQEHFRTAVALARNPTERRFLEQRAAACESGRP